MYIHDTRLKRNRENLGSRYIKIFIIFLILPNCSPERIYHLPSHKQYIPCRYWYYSWMISIIFTQINRQNNILGFFFNFAYLSVVKYGFTHSIDFQISVEMFLFIFFVHFSNLFYFTTDLWGFLFLFIFFGKFYQGYAMNVASIVFLEFVVCPFRLMFYFTLSYISLTNPNL